MNNTVYFLTVYNDRLIAGGSFTTAGGISANRIATWDGTSWQPLGSGMNGEVMSLTVYNGQLIAGGRFTTAGSSVSAYLARWGEEQHTMGDLNHDGNVAVDDVEKLTFQWLETNCESSGFCNEADLNYDRQVDLADFAILADNWLEGL
jgi:hypothetical protein